MSAPNAFSVSMEAGNQWLEHTRARRVQPDDSIVEGLRAQNHRLKTLTSWRARASHAKAIPTAAELKALAEIDDFLSDTSLPSSTVSSPQKIRSPPRAANAGMSVCAESSAGSTSCHTLPSELEQFRCEISSPMKLRRGSRRSSRDEVSSSVLPNVANRRPSIGPLLPSDTSPTGVISPELLRASPPRVAGARARDARTAADDAASIQPPKSSWGTLCRAVTVSKRLAKTQDSTSRTSRRPSLNDISQDRRLASDYLFQGIQRVERERRASH